MTTLCVLTPNGETNRPPTAAELAEFISKMTPREVANLARALLTDHRKRARLLVDELSELDR